MLRQGTCNRCGQCCGADGSPEQRNPWPKTWPDAFRRTQLADLLARWPQGALFGVIQKEPELVGTGQNTGSIRYVGGGAPRDYYYVWVPGHAVCKDTSVAHDGSSYSLECPLLMDDPGDETRPCGLVGEADDNAFRVACEGEPPEEKTVAEVMQWQTRHPLCSYTWM